MKKCFSILILSVCIAGCDSSSKTIDKDTTQIKTSEDLGLAIAHACGQEIPKTDNPSGGIEFCSCVAFTTQNLVNYYTNTGEVKGLLPSKDLEEFYKKVNKISIKSISSAMNAITPYCVKEAQAGNYAPASKK